MEGKTIFLILAGVVGVAFILSFVLPAYQHAKFDRMVKDDKIARAEFMSTFPVEKYGYEKGAIPKFHTDGESIYLEDGRNPDIMYKTDFDGNELSRFDLSEATTPVGISTFGDGYIDDNGNLYDADFNFVGNYFETVEEFE